MELSREKMWRGKEKGKTPNFGEFSIWHMGGRQAADLVDGE